MGNAASKVPYGAHSSLLNTTLSCTSNLATAPFTAPFEISVTAPLASDTEVYFTDIYAQAKFGPSIYTLNSTTTIHFSTNASPSTFSLTSSRIISGDDTDPHVPVEGVATAGPFQMTNDFAHLKVLYVTGDARNADIQISINCTTADHIVISTAKSKLSSANTAPANGVRGSFPATPVGSKSEIANLPVSCSSNPYNLTLQGNIPASIPANAAFNVSNVETFLTTSVGSQTAFVAQYGKKNGNNVPGIAVHLSNALPQDVDIARDFVASDPETSNPLSGGRYTDGKPQSLIIAAPRLGSLSKSFTAGAGGVVSAAFQYFAGTLYTTDGSSSFHCTADSVSALLTAPIVA